MAELFELIETMFRKLYIIIVPLILSVASIAQELHFTVRDKDNNEPIPFAYVHLYKGSILRFTEQTDENGKVSLAINAYPSTVKVTIAGYDPYVVQYDSAATGPLDTTFYIQKKFSALNEVVVTGVSAPTKLQDALSAYQVIPRAIIQAQGAVSLNEVLSKQLNISMSGDGDILGTSMRMQGMGGDKVKILVDGMPVNGRENGNIDLSQISMYNVERIEVVQGPMSIVYGTDAMGGVINIITRQQHKPFGLHIGGLASTTDNYNWDGSLTFAIRQRSQVTIGAARNFFQGWKNIDSAKGYHNDTINTNRCFLFKPDEQLIGNFNYTYTAPSHFRLSLASDLMKETITDRGSLRSWDPFGAYAIDNYFYTDRILNRLSMQGDLGKTGHWTSQNSFAYYHRVHKTINKDMVTMQENLTTNPGDQDTTSSYDYSFRGGYTNHIDRFKYTAGYDVNMQFFNSLKLRGRTNTIQDYAAYADLSYVVLPDMLTVNTGLRSSYNTKYSPPLIPAFNLLLTPLKKMQIRASYAQGYRAPSLKELYLDFEDTNHDITGNDSLKEEHSNQWQLSASYQAIEKQSNYLQFILTGYYNDVNNEISLVHIIDPFNPIAYTYKNASHVANAIANAQADGQYENFHGMVGYSFTHVFQAGNGFDPFNVSEITTTLQYSLPKAGINFNVFYKLTGAQPFLFLDDDGKQQFNGRQAAFSIMDATVQKKLYHKRVLLTAGVKNIFNVQSAQVTGITQFSAHGGTGVGNFLPRRYFASISIDINNY